MGMKFGFFVQQDNPVTQDVNQKEGPSFYLKAAGIAEQLGYDSFWLPDHWMLSRNTGPFDCWSILAAVASVTNGIRLGSLVTPIIAYPPLVLAKRAMTVQMISKGRLIFGLGAGWCREEFEAFGVQFDKHSDRIAKLDEAINLVKSVWNSKEPMDFAGKYYTASKALLMPRVDRPPFWLGGASDKLLALAGKHGDGWVGFEMGHDDLVRIKGKLTDVLDTFGRNISDFQIALATRVVAGKTEKDASETLRRIGIGREYVAPDLPKNLKGHLVAGSYEHCAEELAGYADAGATYLIVSPQPADRTHELLSIFRDELFNRIS